MTWLTDPDAWIALATLTALEIVLGIDNIVFISILAEKLPSHRRARARTLGLSLALVGRIALLLCLATIMRLSGTLFSLLGREISGRDLILIGGGLFLLAKATREIHQRTENGGDEVAGRESVSLAGVLIQILLLDIVFSLDSVITAVGMARELGVMIAAIVIAVAIMIAGSGPIAGFIQRRPTVRMLALSFLLLVGVALIADGLDVHIPRGYIYFAMGYSVFVELLNQRRAGGGEARPTRSVRTRRTRA